MTANPPVSAPDLSGLMPAERDACAIIGFFNKTGEPTHGNVQRTIEALIKMGHRAGEISGEGDGCGVLTDIPRQLWREYLATAGRDPELAISPGFALGHLLLPKEALEGDPELRAKLLQRFEAAGARVLLEHPGPVRSEVLSAGARRAEPLFWQVALHFEPRRKLHTVLYDLHLAIEQETAVHVASLSTAVAAYKIQGAPELLGRYYPELKRRSSSRR